MNLILFDPPIIRKQLLPLTFTRPVAEIRVGIITIAEKWSLMMGAPPTFLCPTYLQQKYELKLGDSNLLVNGSLCPDELLVAAIKTLKSGEALEQEGMLLACNCDEKTALNFEKDPDSFADKFKVIPYRPPITQIKNVWDIFTVNGEEIRNDYRLVTQGRTTQPILDIHTRVYNGENIFVEKGAVIKAAILNAENGPIYIGKNAEIMEGAIIRGPFSIGESSVISMGAKIRGDTTVGPFSKVGGEVSNSVVFGYSNKGHDGYMGNTVLGEWCNLGAATNTSNLKNNYADVKLWNYPAAGFSGSGRQFCGLIMGDHTRCGINTMFNTGTVAGVGANIFGGDYKPNFIPSFSWSDGKSFLTYKMDKFFETAEKAMERRNKQLDSVEKNILNHIFEETAKFRNWENK